MSEMTQPTYFILIERKVVIVLMVQLVNLLKISLRIR